MAANFNPRADQTPVMVIQCDSPYQQWTTVGLLLQSDAVRSERQLSPVEISEVFIHAELAAKPIRDVKVDRGIS